MSSSPFPPLVCWVLTPFPPLQVVPQLRDSVNVWRDFVPVIQYLRNPDMRDRHWSKVTETTHLAIERGDKLTLRVLMGMHVSVG